MPSKDQGQELSGHLAKRNVVHKAKVRVIQRLVSILPRFHAEQAAISSCKMGLPCTAKTTTQWLTQHRIRRFNGGKWPAQSPDLNPIEHLWPMVGHTLVGREFHSRDELWEAQEAAFGSISPAQVQRLYKSLPNRMRAVLDARGQHTRY